MEERKSDIILLLTGTINPNSKDILSVKEPEVRKRQYIDAINFYLEKTHLDIIFAENSGTCIGECFKGQERIEFLTFSSPFTVPDRGKGWKELEIIDYSLKNSKLIHSEVSVLKITGRLKILNIKTIEKRIRTLKYDFDKFVGCNVYKAFKMDSRCFLFTPDFWPVLLKHGQSIHLNYSFERALWKAVCEYDLIKNGKYAQFTEPLRIEGISGGLGISYNNGILLTTIKRVRHFFMLPLVYKKFRNRSI